MLAFRVCYWHGFQRSRSAKKVVDSIKVISRWVLLMHFNRFPPILLSLYLSLTVPSTRTSCLDHAGSHLCSYLGNRRNLKILHTESSKAC